MRCGPRSHTASRRETRTAGHKPSARLYPACLWIGRWLCTEHGAVHRKLLATSVIPLDGQLRRPAARFVAVIMLVCACG